MGTRLHIVDERVPQNALLTRCKPWALEPRMRWWKKQRTRVSWEAELLGAGVPAQFLEQLRAFEDDEWANPWEWLPVVLLGTANQNLYQQDEAAFGADLGRRRAVPVFVESNNDVFVLLVIDADGQRRYVRLGAEEGIIDDFGSDFRLVVADLLISVWESDATRSDIERFSASVGFREWERLVGELERGDRSTVEKDAEWRRTALPSILSPSAS